MKNNTTTTVAKIVHYILQYSLPWVWFFLNQTVAYKMKNFLNKNITIVVE